MKKLFLILVTLVNIAISMYSQDGRAVAGRPVDAKLCNQEHGLRFELYTDGRCKVIVGTDSGWGKYTLNQNRTKITVIWDNGTENRGDITVSGNGVVGILTVEGVKYKPCRD
jgi:hypothetical protein